jgi:L-Ala-D/L-Glu epimerase
MASQAASPEGGAVTGLEVVAYALPFENPYVTARGVLEHRELVLLRVHTDIGLTGSGEAVPLSLRGGESLDQVVGELTRLRDAFADASEQERRDLLRGAFVELSAPSRCALFTAWLDLAARHEGEPMWRLLGAQNAAPVRCNATLTADHPTAVAEQAGSWAGEGYTTFKLKLGLEKDVEQVEAVRGALGDEARLRVDANGSWEVAEAASKLARIARYDIELAEQPCRTLAELAEVRSGSDIWIAADESVSSSQEAESARQARACDFVTLKLSKVGGPGPAQAIANQIPSYLSSALDGPVGIAAAAHLAQALDPDPGLAHGLATQRLFASTIASRECELSDGFLHLPDGPGLGVEIDDAALERHRL